MLSLQEYCGDVINFKTYSKSYKNKKRIVNDEENRAIFLDVHEAIIDRATWEKVQQMRGTRKKRPKAEAQRSIYKIAISSSQFGIKHGIIILLFRTHARIQ